MFDDILLQQKDGATSDLKYVKRLGWHWTSIVSKQKQKLQTTSCFPKSEQQNTSVSAMDLLHSY